jgi:hypothetical protein
MKKTTILLAASVLLFACAPKAEEAKVEAPAVDTAKAVVTATVAPAAVPTVVTVTTAVK